MKRRIFALAVFGVVVAVVGVQVVPKTILNSSSNVADAIQNKAQSAVSTAASTQTSIEAPAIVDTVNLASTINTLIANDSDLETSVSITDLQTGQTYQYGDSAAYTAASITKLITATAYLHSVETGDNTLDASSQALLQKMIVNSDNAAWATLNTELTSKVLLSYAQSVGITSYNPTTNVITSKDIALLLTQLYQNKLLNSDNTSLLLSYMKQAGLRDYIPATIDSSMTVYHKSGYLTDRYNDAAIVDGGNKQYVLVIFSKTTGTYDATEGQVLFHAITKATTDTFLS